MSDNDRATQAEQLIARMQAARGYIYPEWELAARTDRLHRSLCSTNWPWARTHVSAKVRECSHRSAGVSVRTGKVWSPICSGPRASAPPRGTV